MISPADDAVPTDPLLNVEQAAARCNPPMTPSDWRARVARGTAPPPDDPDDDPGPDGVARRPVNRRQPKWLASTVDWFSENATDGRGQPFVAAGEPAQQESDALEVVKLRQHSAHKWAVRERATGTILSRHPSSAAARTALQAHPVTPTETDATDHV